MSTETATRDVLVPDIGDFADVPVIEILVATGDTVAAEDPLVTLESDKATMDVPAPFAGVVQEIKVSAGDRVSEGALLLTLAVEEGEATPDASAAKAEPAAETEKAASKEAAPKEGGSSAAVAPAADAPAPSADNGGAPYASPSVRRLARELGVDLSSVRGSGRKGRITKEDVQKVKDQPAAHAAGGAIEGLNMAPWPKVDFTKFGEVERVELSRIKKISGPNLARNWVMIPHVTHDDEADITDLEAFRKQLNSEQSEAKVTMVALLIKACVPALKKFPDFNASLDGDHLVYKRYFHIGFAADTPGGLVVPVIRDADKKGLLQIATELTDLSGRAREGKLKSTEMQGGCFTISSLGGIGGTGFTPIVNAPEVAILGVTRSAMKPVWDGSQFVPRLIVPLSLSYDHRVIDGALAARFSAFLAGVLNDMRRVLL